MIRVGLDTIIKLNGVEIGGGHNTILSAGFNVIGRRLWDSSYVNQLKYIRFDFSDFANFTALAPYTETSSTEHKIAYTWVAAVPGPVTWIAIHAMFANSVLDADRGASRTIPPFTAHTVNNGDSCIAEFIFTFSGGSAWQPDGFKALGHRCFDPANTYGPSNYFSFDGGSTRVLGTYANVSNSVHDLSCTLPDLSSASTRLYNAATGGNLCFNQSVSRLLVAGQTFKPRLTVRQ